MREIKFRGRRLDNGKWESGDLLENQGRNFIYHATSESTIEDNDDGHIVVVAVEVDPATVGQYTGLKDKNGKKIYEGDIINWLMHRMDRTGYIEEGRVEFRTNEQATVVINKFTTKDGRESVRNILNCLNDLKVIGNIHDNPELMKGGDQ
jgi:uncharacterized phage protein (TIGR01671 family)